MRVVWVYGFSSFLYVILLVSYFWVYCLVFELLFFEGGFFVSILNKKGIEDGDF